MIKKGARIGMSIYHIESSPFSSIPGAIYFDGVDVPDDTGYIFGIANEQTYFLIIIKNKQK